MGNVIGAGYAPADRWLRLSNGLTGAVLAVLLLAGSDRAATPWQRRLVSWLAGHDQAMRGRGTVGFDLDEIAWTAADFAAQQRFLRDVIADAAAGHRWDTLDYPPNRETVLGALARLDALVRDLPITVADTPSATDWPDVDPTGSCPIHRVLLHPDGCLLCNDR